MSAPAPSEGERIIAHVRAMMDPDRTTSLPPLTSDDVLKLIRSERKKREFTKRVVTEINDPDTQYAIVDTLRDLATGLENEERVNNRRADMVGSAGVAPGASVTATAIVLIATSGGALIPVLVLAGGVAGIAGALYGRDHLKQKAEKAGDEAKKLNKFADNISDQLGRRP
jgi:hypothetical protein